MEEQEASSPDQPKAAEKPTAAEPKKRKFKVERKKPKGQAARDKVADEFLAPFFNDNPKASITTIMDYMNGLKDQTGISWTKGQIRGKVDPLRRALEQEET